MHGKGEFKHANGDNYKGNFQLDMMHGKGEFKHANGDNYKGNFQ